MVKKYILPYLTILSALLISACGAYVSVIGLSKLFIAGGVIVTIMMASLELSKLVIAKVLHAEWNTLNKLLKIYLTIAVVVLSTLTSIGLYGFLASAYQESSNKMSIHDKNINVIESKKNRYLRILEDANKEKVILDDNISELRKGLVNNVQSYTDKKGNLVTSSSSKNRRSFEKQLAYSISKREQLDITISKYNDSISKLELNVLDLQSNNEVANELGPLKYISKVLNVEMDKIINILILIIVLVFDPLAICLVIVSGYYFKKNSNIDNVIKTDYGIYEDSVIEDNVKTISSEEIDRRNSIISKINELETILRENKLSSWRENKIIAEIDDLKRKLS